MPNQSKIDQDHTSDVHQQLARALDKILNGDTKPPPVGFVLLTFPFLTAEDVAEGMSMLVNYVSNADRDDIVAALKELVARFDGQAFQSGRA
jgi:hypothetical protein